MQPENLGPLAAALAKAQAEFAPVHKDRTVDTGKYKYTYAQLDKVIDAVRPALAKNGLAFTQLLDGSDLVTMLIHESGAFLMGSVPLPQETTVQAFGSAVTYYRRYALQAILGIAAEADDDGSGADKDKNKPTQRDRVQDAIDQEQAAADAYARQNGARAPQAPRAPVAPPSIAEADIAALHQQARATVAQVWAPEELADIGGMTTNELFQAAEDAGIPKARLTLSAKTMFGANRWEIKNLTDDERAALWAEVAPVAV